MIGEKIARSFVGKVENPLKRGRVQVVVLRRGWVGDPPESGRGGSLMMYDV
jgi:hypothetical protein